MDGKTLCLLCTINYKKALFKKKSNEQKFSKSVAEPSQSSKSRHHHKHKDKRHNNDEE